MTPRRSSRSWIVETEADEDEPYRLRRFVRNDRRIDHRQTPPLALVLEGLGDLRRRAFFLHLSVFFRRLIQALPEMRVFAGDHRGLPEPTFVVRKPSLHVLASSGERLKIALGCFQRGAHLKIRRVVRRPSS